MFAVVAALAAWNAASAQGDRFKVGEETTYRIDYSNTTHSDLRVMFGMDTTSGVPSPLVHHIVTEVHGALEQRVFLKDSVVHIAFRFRDASISITANGANAESDAAAIRDNLAKPMFAILSTTGRINSVSFDPSLDERSRVFARTVLASVQFVIPQSRQSTWTSQEEDPSGKYEASYAGRGTSFTKRKITYFPETPQKTRQGFQAATQTILPSGTVTASLDRTGAMMTLEGDEQHRVTVADKLIARGTTTVRLRRTMAARISQAQLTRLKSLEQATRSVARGMFAPEAGARSDTTIQRNELGSATTASLLARLSGFENSRSDTASSTGLYLKFKALVYLHPESSEELGRALRTAIPNSPTMLIVSQALGTVGHRGAQLALAGAIKSRSSEWPALSTLIPVLGGVNEPIDETVSLILQLAFESANPDIRSTARLAAGTLARNLGSTPRGEAVVTRLVNALKGATSSTTKRELLFAVGNAGSALALPVIQKMSSDSDHSVRAAAFFAMRFMDSSRVDSLLTNASRSDPDSTVRAAADHALVLRRK